MTILEWIDLAKEKLKKCQVIDWRFNNIKSLNEVDKILNEIKELVRDEKDNTHRY